MGLGFGVDEGSIDDVLHGKIADWGSPSDS